MLLVVGNICRVLVVNICRVLVVNICRTLRHYYRQVEMAVRLMLNRSQMKLRLTYVEFSGICPPGPRFREHCQAANLDNIHPVGKETIFLMFWRF